MTRLLLITTFFPLLINGHLFDWTSNVKLIKFQNMNNQYLYQIDNFSRVSIINNF
jgi:hypothetical protein